jgi:hypothetical protein
VRAEATTSLVRMGAGFRLTAIVLDGSEPQKLATF